MPYYLIKFGYVIVRFSEVLVECGSMQFGIGLVLLCYIVCSFAL